MRRPPAARQPGQLSGACARALVRCLVIGHDVRRNTTTVAHFMTMLSCPFPDVGTTRAIASALLATSRTAHLPSVPLEKTDPVFQIPTILWARLYQLRPTVKPE